jgi:hypothetical protein
MWSAKNISSSFSSAQNPSLESLFKDTGMGQHLSLTSKMKAIIYVIYWGVIGVTFYYYLMQVIFILMLRFLEKFSCFCNVFGSIVFHRSDVVLTGSHQESANLHSSSFNSQVSNLQRQKYDYLIC